MIWFALPLLVIGFMLGAKWTRFKYGVSKRTTEAKRGFMDMFRKSK